MIEAVRALVEESGQMSEVGAGSVPQRIMTGGIRAVVRRRLERVPAAARSALRLAAVRGRQIDLPLMRTVLADVEGWLHACADAAVLEVNEQTWRFSHDKLREGLLDDLDGAERRELHHRVALGIERAYPDAAELAPTLAFHYQAADCAAPSLRYSLIAAESALRQGALSEAVAFSRQALALEGRLQVPLLERERARACLIEGLFGLGEYSGCIEVFGDLTALHGERPTVGRIAPVLRLLGAALEHLGTLAREVAGPRPGPSPAPRTSVHTKTSYVRAAEAYVLRGDPVRSATCIIAMLNCGARDGDMVMQSLGNAGVSFMLHGIPLYRPSHFYLARAERLQAQTGDARVSANYSRIASAVYFAEARWPEVLSQAAQSQRKAQQTGDDFALLFALFVRALAAFYRGEYAQSDGDVAQLQEMSSRLQNAHFLVIAGLLRSALALRRGQLARALDESTQTLERIQRGGESRADIFVRGHHALCLLRSGEPGAALEHARALLHAVRGTRLTAARCLESIAGMAEVYLELLARERTPARALDSAQAAEAAEAVHTLQRFARSSRFARSRAALCLSRHALLQERPLPALRHLADALTHARADGLPYEEAVAAAQLGSFRVQHARTAQERRAGQQLLRIAQALFVRLGAQQDAERTAALLRAP